MATPVNNDINQNRPIINLPSIRKPNPILFSLDTDKRKPVLAHEFGNGSPCLQCKEQCPGLDLHFWRKICKACKCSRDDHDIPEPVTDPGKLRVGKLFDKLVKVEDSASLLRREPACPTPGPGPQEKLSRFDWVPPNATHVLIEKFMAQLPEQSRPVKHSEGALKRRQALERQVPLHDIDSAACARPLTHDEQRCMEKFVDYSKREALGQGRIAQQPGDGVHATSHSETAAAGDGLENNADGEAWKCHKCDTPMPQGEIAVFADRAGPTTCWHPQCFVCSECDELLADLIYFYRNERVYCGRHFSNLLFPRCAGCDELIFAKEYTEAENRPWHLDHFCCYSCDAHLGGQRYMVKKEQPYCLACYEKYLARTCELCCQKILQDQHRISHDSKHWHATDHCFFCACCKASLLKRRYVLKNGTLFCSVECKNKGASS